jgi:hypothetical protein
MLIGPGVLRAGEKHIASFLRTKLAGVAVVSNMHVSSVRR